MFCVGINTGLRISDVLNLRVCDVKDKSHIALIEKKTGKGKRFKINDALAFELRNYTSGMAEGDYLFSGQKNRGLPISRVQSYRILNSAAKAVGLSEIGTHTLRKTFGYHFYQQYKDVALLQELFNHSAPSVTLRYIGINQDAMDKAMSGFEL
jgi:integrase